MRKSVGMLAVAILGASLLSASPAQAGVSLSGVSLSTGTAVVNGDAGCGNRTTVTVKVYHPETDLKDVWGVSASVYNPAGDVADFLPLPYARRSGDYVFYTDAVFLCGWEPPGRYRIHTEVDWWDEELGTPRQATADTAFYVKRPTSLTYNASPEPARRGSYLTHSGRLMFDPFAAGAMYGPSGVRLRIAFKKAGTSTFVTKGSVTTGSGGYYLRKLQAWDDGTWRVEFPTNTWRQTRLKYDYVDVR